MRQLYVDVPLSCFSTRSNLPGPAAISGSGTVMCIAAVAGLSDGWSLHGKSRSAPSFCNATETQSAPLGVFSHMIPPIHGARGATRGLPPYEMIVSNISPGCFVNGNQIQIFPPRRSHFSGD